jgi:hypothetical protein
VAGAAGAPNSVVYKYLNPNLVAIATQVCYIDFLF